MCSDVYWGDLMFLYRFVRRRCQCRPQILVHAITFEQLFYFLLFLPRLLAQIRFWSIFVVTLTLNFQGQTWNLLYLSQNWLNCHETKSKHIDWSQALKYDHRVWPWPWHWPWIFKIKYGIGYISAKNGPNATERRANTSNVTTRFVLGYDLHLEFSRSNTKFAISQPKVVRLARNEKQTYWLNSRPQMWPVGLTLAMTLIFEFSRSYVILTIWWPRSSVRIYQIVTGVASDVGVPSTHLVPQTPVPALL